MTSGECSAQHTVCPGVNCRAKHRQDEADHTSTVGSKVTVLRWMTHCRRHRPTGDLAKVSPLGVDWNSSDSCVLNARYCNVHPTVNLTVRVCLMHVIVMYTLRNPTVRVCLMHVIVMYTLR